MIWIFLGLILGFGIGVLMFYFNYYFFDIIFFCFNDIYLINGVFYVVGKIFVNLFKLMIVFLVLVFLVCGVIVFGESKSLGCLGIKMFLLYLFIIVIVIILVIIVVSVVDFGVGISLDINYEYFKLVECLSLVQVFIDIFLFNLFSVMVEGNMLQVIVFVILVGIVLNNMGESGKCIGVIFEDMNIIVMKLVEFIMWLVFYGVFFLVVKVFVEQGLDILKGLSVYMFCVVFVLFLYLCGIYMGILMLVVKFNFMIFMKKMCVVLIFVFSIVSSVVIMLVILGIVEKKLGVKNLIVFFIIFLGIIINMDGIVIMQGVVIVFIVGVYGIDLMVF